MHLVDLVSACLVLVFGSGLTLGGLHVCILDLAGVVGVCSLRTGWFVSNRRFQARCSLQARGGPWQTVDFMKTAGLCCLHDALLVLHVCFVHLV